MLSTYAKKISGSTVTCTTEEKVSLMAEVTALDTAIAKVKSALAAIQEQIESKLWLGGLLCPLSLLTYSSSDRLHGLHCPAGSLQRHDQHFCPFRQERQNQAATEVKLLNIFDTTKQHKQHNKTTQDWQKTDKLSKTGDGIFFILMVAVTVDVKTSSNIIRN